MKELLVTERNNGVLDYLKKEFDKNNIKYKMDLKEEWKGSIRTPKYIGKVIVNVEDEYLDSAKEVLNKYYEKNPVNSNQINFNEMDNSSRKYKRIFAGIVIGMIIIMIVAILFSAGEQ